MIRVVSLVPSATETLVAWGVVPVGTTRFCEAQGTAKVGGTKNPDLGAIGALAPDLVVMDREENRKEDAEALEQMGLPLLVTHVRSIEDVDPALRRMAEAVGVEHRPPAAGRRPPYAGPRVFVPIWRRPWMTIAGRTYGGSMLAAAGFINVFHAAPDDYPTVTLEEAAARDPQLVLAPSEPYPFRDKHRSELERVARAVMVDGQDLFWWGVRTPAAVGRMQELARSLKERQVSNRN